MTTLDEVRQRMAAAGAARLDLHVADLLGRWHRFSMPATRLTEASVVAGFGFDGSSLRGLQPVEASDMLLRPDLSTAIIDPVQAPATLSIICDIADPATGQPSPRNPRAIAARAEEYLRASGIADTANFGAELEFFVFDEVRYQQLTNTGFYYVDSAEGHWNTGRDEQPNRGGKIPAQGGYAPAAPFDRLGPLRWAIADALTATGQEVEIHHHEVASGGQCALATRYDSLARKADQVQWYRYIVQNAARLHGQVATFMPKPLAGANGSGMHTHQSLWKDGMPLFHDPNGYAGLSQTARWYLGGLLRHAPALMALCAPTTNSYRRLVPGFEAPVHLTYSNSNRTAAVRIPAYDSQPAATRIEFRPPDAMANPYLAFPAMLMAGLDGIRQRIDPGDPMDRNLYELTAEEAARIPSTPGTLPAALDALAADRAFLQEGGVFPAEIIDTWLTLKRAEVREVEAAPTPAEYEAYFNG